MFDQVEVVGFDIGGDEVEDLLADRFSASRIVLQSILEIVSQLELSSKESMIDKRNHSRFVFSDTLGELSIDDCLLSEHQSA
jgi:hypothetical protein